MFHVSNTVAGLHQHYFQDASTAFPSTTLASGDTIYTWIWLVDNALPTEIMLQFYACTGGSCDWEHRAYWGANNIAAGTNGTASRWQVSASLPGSGSWAKLAVSASAVGLTGKQLKGMAYALYDGKAFWDDSGYVPSGTTAETVWVNDAVPAGATKFTQSGDAWTWSSSTPLSPVLGTSAHVSASAAGEHQHFFYNATTPMPPSGTFAEFDEVHTYVYLSPNDMPSEVMLQFYACDANGSNCNWLHRAYWGDNLIAWGTNHGYDRFKRSPLLPSPGTWQMLSVPAGRVGLTGKKVTGMAFVLYGGSAYWDNAGYRTVVGTPVVPAAGVQRSTQLSAENVWMDDSVPAGATQTSDGGDSWSWTQLTPTGVTVAEYREQPTTDSQIVDPATRDFFDTTLWSCASEINADIVNIDNISFGSEARYNDPVYCGGGSAHLSYARTTEIWGAMFRPSSLVSGKKYPVVVMVHGDYGSSCTYPDGIINGAAGSSLTGENNDYVTYNGVCRALAYASALHSYNGQCADDSDCLGGLPYDSGNGPNHCDASTHRCVGGGCSVCSSQDSVPTFGTPISTTWSLSGCGRSAVLIYRRHDASSAEEARQGAQRVPRLRDGRHGSPRAAARHGPVPDGPAARR